MTFDFRPSTFDFPQPSPRIVLFSHHKANKCQREQSGHRINNQIEQAEMTFWNHPLQCFIPQTDQSHQSQGPDIEVSVLAPESQRVKNKKSQRPILEEVKPLGGNLQIF